MLRNSLFRKSEVYISGIILKKLVVSKKRSNIAILSIKINSFFFDKIFYLFHLSWVTKKGKYNSSNVYRHKNCSKCYIFKKKRKILNFDLYLFQIYFLLRLRIYITPRIDGNITKSITIVS
jgi:hypothetical protein